MSGYIRQIQSSDGTPITAPSNINTLTAGLVVFADDAAYEAVYGAGVQGSKYFNSTQLLEREHDGTSWISVSKALNADTDSTTTGTDQDLGSTRFDLIRFTEGSLDSVRSIDPAQHKILYFVNDQGSQSITWKNEDGAATAANRIITGTGDDLVQEIGTVLPFIYDSSASRWRVAGGAGGAGGGWQLKVITNADSPYTASIQEWLLTDTSGGAITVNMPELATLPGSKEALAYVKFSDCASNWHVDSVTVQPFSGESLDSQAADEPYELNVEAQNISFQRASASNWCLDTNIQPTEDTGGDTGVGLLNFLENGDFNGTAGTTGWTKTAGTGVSLDTSTQLEGDASLTWTNDGGLVEGNLNIVDLAYRGYAAQSTARLRCIGVGGNYKAYLTDDGVMVPATETEINLTGGGTAPITMFGFTLDDSVYKYVIESVDGDAADVLTLDIVNVTTQGAGQFAGLSGEWEDVTGSLSYSAGFGTPTSESTIRRKVGDSYQYKGYFRTGSVTGTGGSHIVFPFDIDISKLPQSEGSSVYITKGTAKRYGDPTFTDNDFEVAVDSSNLDGIYFRLNALGSATFGGSPSVNSIIGSTVGFIWEVTLPAVELSGNGFQALSKGAVLQNAYAELGWLNGKALSAGSNDFSPDSVTIDNGFTWNGGTNELTPLFSGRISVATVFRGTALANHNFSVSDGVISRTFATWLSTSTAETITGEMVFPVTQGTPFKIRTFMLSGSTANGNGQIVISRLPNDTGNLATGAGTDEIADETPRKLLVNYQEKTIDTTGSGAFTGGNIRCIRIGNVVTLSADQALTHSNSSSPSSAGGFLPEFARPTTAMVNCIRYDETQGFTFRIDVGGTIQMIYKNESGNVSRTDSLFAPTITYAVN